MNYYYTETEGGMWRKWPDYCPIPTFDDLDRKIVHGTGRESYVQINCPIRNKAIKVHAFCRPSGFVWDAWLAVYDKRNGTVSNNRKVDPKLFVELL